MHVVYFECQRLNSCSCVCHAARTYRCRARLHLESALALRRLDRRHATLAVHKIEDSDHKSVEVRNACIGTEMRPPNRATLRSGLAPGYVPREKVLNDPVLGPWRLRVACPVVRAQTAVPSTAVRGRVFLITLFRNRIYVSNRLFILMICSKYKLKSCTRLVVNIL